MHDAIVLSDLHLGAPNCQHQALSLFFKRILDGSLQTKKIILNGDTFDSIDFRRLSPAHWDLFRQIRELSDFLPVRWIYGNHDSPKNAFATLLGTEMLEEYVLHSGSRRFLVLHGHQFDTFLDRHPKITLIADCAYRMLQILDPSHTVARFAKRTSKSFLHCTDKIRTEATIYALSRHMDGVICGHTHRALSKEEGLFGYHNSGCWTENPSTWLSVKDGEVSLSVFDENSSKPIKVLTPAHHDFLPQWEDSLLAAAS